MKKNLIVPSLAVVAIASALLFGSHNVLADTAGNAGGPESTIIQKLVDRFGLKTDEVNQVFTEVRQEKELQMQAKFDAGLAQLVTDGKITSSQKDAIVAKRTELQSEMKSKLNAGKPEDFKNLTEEQRKAGMEEMKTRMEAQKTELENWAKSIGLDTQYLRYVAGHGGSPRGGHPGGPFGGKPFDFPQNNQ